MSVKRFVVRVGERSYEVEVDPKQNPTGATRVRVGDAAFDVRGMPGDMTLVREAEGTRQRRVVVDDPARPGEVAIDGVTTTLEVLTAQQAAFEAAMAASGGGGGAGRIEAPMSGAVVKVLVTEGESVERDAPVVIVEAMKMENELRSPIDGVVQRVAVEAGQAVDAGQLLCEIVAHPDDASA